MDHHTFAEAVPTGKEDRQDIQDREVHLDIAEGAADAFAAAVLAAAVAVVAVAEQDAVTRMKRISAITNTNAL